MTKRNKMSLSETHPHLVGEWDFDKNSVRPEDVTRGSNKKIWWVCKKCGDYWHGNPEVKKFSPNKINEHNKKSFGQLYQETMERIDLLKENGYKVVYIWESDYSSGGDL